MGRAKTKEDMITPDMIDDSIEQENLTKVEMPASKYARTKKVVYSGDDEKEFVNCLRNEKVIVRFIPKAYNLARDPKHVFYGGMSENASRIFVVPRLSSGLYANVLTNSEKKYLEHIMGLEPDALSIYKKNDNFWDDSNELGISRVRLLKQDNYLDLSAPEDYIRYKILLANKSLIASSYQELEDHPKATYQFVIISTDEETKRDKAKINSTMEAYKEFGKIENNIDVLRVIVELIEGRPTSSNVKLEFLQSKVNDIIQSNSKLFLKVLKDEYLETKVLIKKSIEAGNIYKRGDYHYLKSDNTPLCEANEEPTLNIAAKYLNHPKHQEVKFALEAKLRL